MNKELNVRYIWAYSDSMPRIWRAFKKELRGDYPWLTGERPKLFRNMLITPLARPDELPTLLEHVSYFRELGDMEFLMFDSGGFQTLRNPNIKINNIIEDNLYLYNTYDQADAYVLPDLPTFSKMPLSEIEANIHDSIPAAFALYNKLPEHIQAKSMPVYHVHKKSHIDWQFEHYSKITEHSKMCCYVIPPPSKRLTFEHMKWIQYLKSLQPDCWIHLLGTSAQLAIYAMEQIGVNSFDSITPSAIGGNGFVANYVGQEPFSVRVEDSVSEEEILEKCHIGGHRCSFCDEENIAQMKTDHNHRIIHNIIVFHELARYYRSIGDDAYKEIAPEWYEILTRALDPSVPIPEEVIRQEKKSGKPKAVEQNQYEQMSLF